MTWLTIQFLEPLQVDFGTLSWHLDPIWLGCKSVSWVPYWWQKLDVPVRKRKERKRKKLTPVPCTRMNASPWAQYWSCYPWCSMGRYVPVHLLLGGKDLGIQQGTSVWVSSPKSFNGLPITCHSWNPYSQFWNHLRTSRSGLTWVKKRNWCALLVAKPSCTHTLVPWRQGFRHPTRNELMG